MFTPILETAIGLFFVYLLLSMICSALLEWIAALLALRAKTLFNGLKQVLCADAPVVHEIYKHPLIKGLSRRSWWDRLTRRKAGPSYISGNVFSKAFLSVVGITSVPSPIPTQTVAGTGLSQDAQTMLKTFVPYAPTIDDLQKNVEDWYNEAMDRVSGWYKRKAYGITLLIALFVAGLVNADSIMLVRVFWTDPTVRTAAAAAATDWINSHKSQQSNANRADIGALYPSVSDDKPEPPPPPEERFMAASENLSSTYSQVASQLQRAKIPIGWCSQDQADSAAPSQCVPGQSFPSHKWEWFYKLSGILITIVALSQGSPFWFDLLQKLVNIRLAGTAPDEKKI